jgi:ribonuclease HI
VSRSPGPSYILTFDGGSRGNPGPAYGSYRIQRRGAAADGSRHLRFGRGTNNESEYWALIAGLRALLAELEADGVDPARVRLEVRGDSQLVIRQLEGEWKAKDLRMRGLRDQALRLLAPFDAVRLTHHDRARSVAIFGH